MGAKRATANYAVPFRQVWEHLGSLQGSIAALLVKQKSHDLPAECEALEKGGRLLIGHPHHPMTSTITFFETERVKSVGEIVFECHFLFLSLFWAHRLHSLLILF